MRAWDNRRHRHRPTAGDIVATKRDVETKLRELIRRLEGAEEAQGSLAGALPDGRILSLHLTDLDAEYWSKIAEGRMGSLHRGAPDRSDIRIRMTSDDLVAFVDGNGSLFSAVVTGRVKVEASIVDLLRLRRLA